ncbi:Rho GDP-dissociation inhibitor 1-like protein [Tanacetum coccineum]
MPSYTSLCTLLKATSTNGIKILIGEQQDRSPNSIKNIVYSKFSIIFGTSQDDESLRRWKEKLLGSVEGDFNGQIDPEVRFSSLGISKYIEEITISLPLKEALSGRPLFTLREGAHYRFKLTFTVLHNIVSGLTCTNTI